MKRFSLLTLLLACATGLFAQDDCPNPYDGNADGMVNISDLLDLLALFGDFDTDLDGVWDSADDCVDPEACNYTADPTETCLYIDALDVCGGACEGDEDGDGICDDIDTCVGTLDECGVCNGPGPTEIVIDEIVTTYDSIFLPVDEEWFVFAAEVDTVFSYTCAPSFASCGDPVSYQGYDYATVQIGDQCWFAENLRNENYRNGDSIPSGFDCEQWEFFLTSGAVASYNPVNDCNDGSSDLDVPGLLYNWYAVDDDRRLCPAGWHVPSDGEWMRLENSLGMPVSELNTEGWRGSDQGSQLKTDYGWHNEGNGTNSSGFSALPSGGRGDLVFFGITTWSIWWTPTKWTRSLYFNNQKVNRDNGSARLSFGYSVRCVQDGLICEADEDEDGICDDLDDCVGEFDACGVCNGPGAIYNCGCEECPAFECGDPTTYQGYDYATVLIGEQCWFAENLRNENYENGDAIPANLSDSEWSSTTSGAVAVYGEGSSTCGSDSPDGYACDESWSLNEYGRLYNWYAVDDARGLCPSGWHVPTDEEWMTLEMALGMSEAEANSLYYRGTDQGEQMKTDYGWEGGFNGTNASGFSGLPGGGRRYDGNFFGWAGTRGFWWTSSPSGSYAYWRQLNQGFNGVDRQGYLRRAGLSVRCVQDGLICEADEDEDGICDDLDDCVGEFDACGVCNGPGAIYDCGCEECPAFECGDPTTYQGYDYATVQIGDQCWFAENLRNENYANGDAIPAYLSDSEWGSTTSGAVAVYGEGVGCADNSPDIDACDPAQSLNEYGRLYNWYAVGDPRGLCPSEWHVPTDGEWTVMTDYLGGTSAAGGQMKTDYGWIGGGNGTNSSGFSGLPGGARQFSNGFSLGAGDSGFWWSSSPFGSDAWKRALDYPNESVHRSGSDPRQGFSVRCVRDAE